MELDEFSLIRLLTEEKSKLYAGKKGIAVGIGDDAAVVDVPAGRQVVMSCDTMVQEVHFSASTMRDEDVGFKAMASNLSDIAAMGGEPQFALVALSVPRSYTSARLKRLYDGLYECADRYGVAVVGGDTTSSPSHLTVTVTIIGTVEAGKALLRSGAREGDALFVTGLLGGSAAGLHYLLARGKEMGGGDAGGNADAGAGMMDDDKSVNKGDADKPLGAIPHPYRPLVEAHCRPLPSVEAGRIFLRSGYCSALNDVSDGLASEAREIAEASQAGIELHATKLPMDASMTAYAREVGIDPLNWALYGGEDYCLTGTISPDGVEAVQRQCKEAGIPFHIVGTVTSRDRGVILQDVQGNTRALEAGGYNHFRG
jgi:thiamine-monophosphate kinase